MRTGRPGLIKARTMAEGEFVLFHLRPSAVIPAAAATAPPPPAPAAAPAADEDDDDEGAKAAAPALADCIRFFTTK